MIPERIYKFDNIKVWLMLLIIVAHTLTNSYGTSIGVEYIRFFCLCYTMPLFTFMSGYVAKSEVNMKKLVSRLLVPVVIFSIIDFGLSFIFNRIGKGVWLPGIFPGFALWYIFVLFFYKATLKYAVRIPFLLPLSFGLSWISGAIPYVGLDFQLERLFCFYPYFLLGYYAANSKLTPKIHKMLTSTCTWGVILLILVLIVGFFVIANHPGLTYKTAFCNHYSSNILLDIIVTIFLQVLVTISGLGILMAFPNKNMALTKYGTRTMNVYLLHPYIVLPAAYYLFPPFGTSTTIEQVFLVVFPTTACMLFFTKSVDTFIKTVFRW